MTTYTTLPQDDENLEITVTEADDLVSLNIQPAAVSITSAVTSVNGEVGNVILDTDDIDEGVTNLYYTNERVDDEVNSLLQAGNGIRLDYDDANNELTIDSDLMEETVKNETGGTLTKGTLVYVTGISGDKPTVAPADSTSASHMPAVGVLDENIADDAEGRMLIVGKLSGVDTSAFAEGDTVYVNGSGQFTNVRPTSETELVQNMGFVTKVHATQGGMIIYGSGRSNDVPNLDTGHVFIGNGPGYDTRQLTTDDVNEGTNLYYTQARFDSAFTAKSTTDLSEGTNLYYTDARVQTVIDTNTAGFITASSTDTLTNKSGLISQWTNDAGYLTSETDSQTLSFASPNLTISNGNTVDLSAILSGYATEAYVDQAEAVANTYTDNELANATVDGGTFQTD